MHRIIVFSKDGCHLCERAVNILKDLSKNHKFRLEVVEITKNEALFEKYFLKIPVVRVDGKDMFDAEDLRTPLEYKRKLMNLVSDLDNFD